MRAIVIMMAAVITATETTMEDPGTMVAITEVTTMGIMEVPTIGLRTTIPDPSIDTRVVATIATVAATMETVITDRTIDHNRVSISDLAFTISPLRGVLRARRPRYGGRRPWLPASA